MNTTATARRAVFAAACLIAGMLGLIGAVLAQTAFRTGFDHFSTGWPLEGSHRNVACERCHVGGVFQGTPRQCAACHSRAGLVKATAPPVDHPLTTQACQDCHRETTWSPVIQVDHSQVLGSCASCHNGSTATGKPAGHLPTTAGCDDCHTTTAWTPAVFDHAGVAPGSCSSCHNGSTASGKPAGHIATTAQCDACHTTIAWTPAVFDHAGVAPGSCASCHNGSTATGKPAQHFVTARSCDECHSTSSWSPLTFVHTSPAYPGDHAAALQCTDCHGGNAEAVTWPFAAYQPDCAGCHAGDFRPGPHKKYENPDTYYTVTELRNCTGACHVYTDATLTTISKSRPGPEHRVNAGGF